MAEQLFEASICRDAVWESAAEYEAWLAETTIEQQFPHVCNDPEHEPHRWAHSKRSDCNGIEEAPCEMV